MDKTYETRLKVYKPFGPSIGMCKLPMELVEDFNKDCDSIHNTNKIKERDWSDNLVGNVKQELLITPKTFTKWAGFFETIVSDFIKSHEEGRSLKRIRFQSGWYVRQFKGDFNPYHYHSDCHLSCVGYLKIPEGMEEEWKKEDKDHHPSAGYIEMSYGQVHLFSNNTIKVKPRVGDYYLFPWWQYHMVYPFRSEGERRSFSFNVYGDSDDLPIDVQAKKDANKKKSKLIL